MFEISFVFLANVFEKLGVRKQVHIFSEGPGFRIGLRIADCELNFHVPEIPSPKLLDYV